MALKAGRVGVAPSQVDKNGNITGGGSSVTVVDNLNSTSSTDALSAKQGNLLKQMIENAGGITVTAPQEQTTSTNQSTGDIASIQLTKGKKYIVLASIYANIPDNYVLALVTDTVGNKISLTNGGAGASGVAGGSMIAFVDASASADNVTYKLSVDVGVKHITASRTQFIVIEV